MVDKGAYPCSDLNDAAQSDILITMLADGQVVKGVVERLVAENQLTEDKIVIDMSSTSLDEVKEISELALSSGASFIDAPVSGGVKGAEEGTLAIMAGSQSANHFNAVEDVLRAMGRPGEERVILVLAKYQNWRIRLLWAALSESFLKLFFF